MARMLTPPLGVSTVFGSVGQMIPFLVGMGSLVAVILEWNVKPSCVGCKLVIGEDGKPLDTEVEKGALGPRATKRVLTGMSGKTMTTSRSNTGLSEKMPVPTRSTTGLSGKTMMGSRSNTGLSEMTTEPSRIAGLSERLRTQLAKEMLNRGLSKDSPSRRVTKRNTATSPGETSTTEQQPTGSIATEDEVTTIEQSEPEEDVREKAA